LKNNTALQELQDKNNKNNAASQAVQAEIQSCRHYRRRRLQAAVRQGSDRQRSHATCDCYKQQHCRQVTYNTSVKLHTAMPSSYIQHFRQVTYNTAVKLHTTMPAANN